MRVHFSVMAKKGVQSLKGKLEWKGPPTMILLYYVGSPKEIFISQINELTYKHNCQTDTRLRLTITTRTDKSWAVTVNSCFVLIGTR